MRLRPILLLTALLAGCSGSTPSLIAFGPPTQTIDVGTTVTLLAAVVNDANHAGATFALAGPGTLGTPVTTNQAASDQIALPYTATAPGTATITATSVHTPSQTTAITITVSPALTISPATLPAGNVNTAYSATVTATGGTGAITYTVSAGTLPPGLAPNSGTGVLSGKPTTAGTYNFTITATDSASTPGTISQAYTVVINPLPPAVTPASLPTGVVGTAYSQQLAYTGGGTQTPVFAITSGALPATSGITLSASGLIAGNPTAAAAGQTYSFSVTVTVGTQTSPAVPFTLSIASVPVITTTSLPPGNVSIPYRQQLNYTGGVGTATFAITSGTLPATLTLSPSGLLSGTPTAVATYTFSVTVTVGTQTSAPQAYTLVVNSLIVTSGSTATGETALPFSFQLTAAGGKPPYTWSLAPGSAPLPAGLTLATNGLITGTPTTAATTPGVVVQANDSATPSASSTLSMTFTINPARSAASNALLTGSYAFLLSGFDAQGNPRATAGRFVADGLGNITSGSLDTNSTGLATAQTGVAILPSTYSAGPDNRGKLNLTTATGTNTFTFALDTVTNGIASGGTLSQYDLSGQTRTGVLALQALTIPVPTSTGYAFGLQGFAANSTATLPTHRAAAGEIQLTAVTSVTAGELLLSSSGTPAPIIASSGTLNLATTGRGTLSITYPNFGTLNFVVYEVSSQRLFLVSSDPASGTTGTRDLLSGQALSQTVTTGNFNNASLNAATVFHVEKLTAGNPDVQLGLLTPTSAGVLTQVFDENNGGALSSINATGTYTVSTTGRISITSGAPGLGGCTDCTSGALFGYMTGLNQAFLMDFSTGALSGFFEPQSATTLANAAYSLGTPEPLSPAATSTTGVATVTTGNLTATEDVVNTLTLTPSLAISGTTTAGTNGRFTTTLTGPGYVVSPTRAETLDPTPKPVLQILNHQ